MTRINTNVPSFVAQNRLNRSNADLQETLTRLSTGLRINSGKDDPAGLIASESLRSEITSITKAISNTNRANQIITTADSALGQVSSLLNDVRGLVVEAANSGALSDDEIAANQLQIDSSLEAINRIAQTTTFQGRKLLDGSLDFVSQSGTNFSNIRSLQIDQANLGATGRVDVQIDIQAAATKAAVDVEGFTAPVAGVSATASLTVGAPVTAVAATGTINIQSTGVAAQTAAPGSLSVGGDTITLTQANSGEAGNVAVNYINSTGATGVTAAVNGTTGAIELTYDQARAISAEEVQTAINTLTGTTGVTASGATADVESTGTVAVGTDTLTITANRPGAAGDVAVNFIDDVPTGATPVASINGTSGAIEVRYDQTGSVTSQQIQDAINLLTGDSGFTVTGGGTQTTTGAQAGTTLAGGAGELSTPATLLTGATLTGGADEVFTSSIAVTSTTGNGADGNVAITFANVANQSGVTAAVDAQTGAITVSYDQSVATSGADIAAAIDLLADYSAVNTGTGTTVAASLATGTTLTGGITANTASTITVTSPVAGGDDNVAINYINSATATSTTAAINATTGALEVTANFANAVTAQSIQDAINTLDGYSATGAAANSSSVAGTPPAGGLLASGVALEAGGVQADAVFELAGKSGSEVFNVSAGTTLAQLVDQINLVSDATGISAEVNGTTLELRSSDYGRDSLIDLRVISEGAGGNFGNGSRAVGTDIEATINGRRANSKGNEVSLNTATLDLKISLAAEQTDSSSFSITGGGALFQLGADVVSNQQARIGLQSVSAARLGGIAGKLFELGSGESASLTTDANKAARIVTESINQVTSLRGRLGAFQATTLESNQVSLSDTVANLQEAESSIRDADFAKEAARLTRAQILVQSGTTVLQQANQNPQSVLSLLR